MEHPQALADAAASGEPGGTQSLGFLDLFVILAKRKYVVLAFPIIAAVFAAVVSLLMPNVYTATAIILPPQQSQSTANAVLGQLGALAGAAGGVIAQKSPNELYVGMLRSRTIADSLIKRFDLKAVYGQDSLAQTRRELEGVTGVVSRKDGLIAIEVSDKDPKRAAAIANAYVDELDKVNQTLAVSEASQRRLFFEKQLRSAKSELAVAEVSLRKTQETTGLIKLDDQGRAIIESVARLQALVASKEVQLAAMKAYATESNPDLLVVQRELSGLKSQLAKAERDSAIGGGNVFVPTGKIPEVALEYARKFRDVKYFETILDLLAKQYEVAKIDEAKDASLIQVLDSAVEPEKKSRPNRRLIVELATIVGLLIGMFVAFVLELGVMVLSDAKKATQLQLIRSYLTSR